MRRTGGNPIVPRASIADLPDRSQRVQFPPSFKQRFLLTVDTEEEFDWSQPITRDHHTVHSVARLARFQEFCESFGIVPVYLVDYPVANSPAAREALKPAVAAGRAEIGIQLHPWVNPPHEEQVSQFNSFAGNLPPALEQAKFRHLKTTIEQGFETAPLIYRAGRYGAGPHTAAMLADHGIAIDTSVRPCFDYSDSGGPDYSKHPVAPWWIGSDRRVMELPLTTVYWGLLRQLGPQLYPRLWRMPQLRGLLARFGLLERIPLTPEGVTLDEAIRGIDLALDQGLPLLVFSFHSPSLAPGFTPYVRNEAELDALYDWWRGVFAYLQRRNIAPISVKDVMDAVTLA